MVNLGSQEFFGEDNFSIFLKTSFEYCDINFLTVLFTTTLDSWENQKFQKTQSNLHDHLQHLLPSVKSSSDIAIFPSSTPRSPFRIKVRQIGKNHTNLECYTGM